MKVHTREDVAQVALAFGHSMGPWQENADWAARHNFGEPLPAGETMLYAVCRQEGCDAWMRWDNIQDACVWLGINAACPWDLGIVRVP